jgi:RND family efflux transporter MFP subunit
MTRYWRPALAVAAVVAVVAFIGMRYWLLHPRTATAAPGTQVPVVRTVVSEVAAASADLRLPARTAPVEQALIYARATGVVSERRVDIGSRVRRGDVLALIAAPEIDQGVDKARAAVAQAKAKEQFAATNLQRSHQLVDQGFLSKQVLDERQAGFDAAQADRLAAEAELRRLNEIKGFQVVRAPFSGVIAERRVDRGDRVVGDQGNAEGYMFRLVRVDELRVSIDAPQAVVMQVQAGMTAEVIFPELAGEKLAAKVVRSAGVIDARTGTMHVELALPNPGGRIPAGMLGEVAIRVPRAHEVLLVPNSTLIVRDGKAQVARVVSSGAEPQGTLRFLPVQLGRNLGNKTEVLAGIPRDAALVNNPNALLRDGDSVRAEAMPEAQGASAKK